MLRWFPQRKHLKVQMTTLHFGDIRYRHPKCLPSPWCHFDHIVGRPHSSRGLVETNHLSEALVQPVFANCFLTKKVSKWFQMFLFTSFFTFLYQVFICFPCVYTSIVSPGCPDMCREMSEARKLDFQMNPGNTRLIYHNTTSVTPHNTGKRSKSYQNLTACWTRMCGSRHVSFRQSNLTNI